MSFLSLADYEWPLCRTDTAAFGLPAGAGLNAAGFYSSGVAFDVGADAYSAFMGRYSEPLADLFVQWAGVGPGRRALDVGCGPGALTVRLVERLGAARVIAVDPSASFVAAARRRCPGVVVHQAAAERLPLADRSVDAALAQLVVHFMADPVAGLAEMARVTRPGGVVAACVWDFAGGSGPLTTFWSAVRDLDPARRGRVRSGRHQRGAPGRAVPARPGSTRSSRGSSP